jgi:hypothetical protein
VQQNVVRGHGHIHHAVACLFDDLDQASTSRSVSRQNLKKKDKNPTEKEASRRFSRRHEAWPAGVAGRPLLKLGGKADGHLMACRPCSYRQGMNSEPSSHDKITKLLSKELHSAVGIENDSFWTEVLAE